MPAFAYQGIDDQGRAVSGTVTASSRDAAMERIRALQGEQATEIVESDDGRDMMSRTPSRPDDLGRRTGEPDAGTRHGGGSRASR